MQRIIFHIDVNSAFLSWTAVELLNQGAEIDIREIPSIIGGDKESRHGVVLAKSTSAKKFGIQTGEPVAHALRKCPNLHIEPPNHKMYRACSERLMEHLRSYTPDIEQVSVDECFMDFTGIVNQYKSPIEAASQMKEEIFQKFGFTVNIGISSNKLLAKMASDFEKPNKIHTLFPDEIETKMWPLSVGELYMAGKSSVDTLRKLEIFTIGDLAKTDPSLVELHLKKHGKMLWRFANGIDESEVETVEAAAKGIGNSTTLSKDVTEKEEAQKVLLYLAESVGRRLRTAKQKAYMVSVEIKYHTFQSTSHQKQLLNAVDADTAIYQAACELFDELWSGQPIRLLGIRTSKLVDEAEPVQLSIFDIPQYSEKDRLKEEKRRKVSQTMDEIRKKYGKDAVVRGTMLNS